eukprot:129640-Heterocapsa_arctica.AAC.1
MTPAFWPSFTNRSQPSVPAIVIICADHQYFGIVSPFQAKAAQAAFISFLSVALAGSLGRKCPPSL